MLKGGSMNREPNEIEALKRNWERDPCWDIEKSEGFESHKEELLAYRKEKETLWKEQRELHRKELASKVCPLILFSLTSNNANQSIYENSRCLVEHCAWWNESNECCVIRALTLK